MKTLAGICLMGMFLLAQIPTHDSPAFFNGTGTFEWAHAPKGPRFLYGKAMSQDLPGTGFHLAIVPRDKNGLYQERAEREVRVTMNNDSTMTVNINGVGDFTIWPKDPAIQEFVRKLSPVTDVHIQNVTVRLEILIEDIPGK